MIACTKIEFPLMIAMISYFFSLIDSVLISLHLFSPHALGFDEGRRFIFGIFFSLPLHIAILLSYSFSS